MRFDNLNRSEKEPTNNRVSRIHEDWEVSCNNKNVHQGVQVPQQPIGSDHDFKCFGCSYFKEY